MPARHEFIKYRPEYKEQLCRLQQPLWGPHSDLNSAYFEWKYERNPIIDEPLVYLALADGDVVGMRGMMGALWEGGDGSSAEIPIAGDLVVHPDHQTKGIVRQLMEYALHDAGTRGYRYVLNLSGNRYTQLTSLRMGWRMVGDCEEARWCWRPGPIGRYLAPHLRSLSRKLSEHKGHPFALLDKLFRPGSSHISMTDVARPSEMAALVAQIPWDGRLRQRRDDNYFTWRFQNPRSAYRFVFYDAGNLRGYLALEARRRSSTVSVRIADWESTDDQVASELLQPLTRSGGMLRYTAWTASLESSRVARLKAAGFEPVESADVKEPGKGRAVLVRGLQPADAGSSWTLFNRRVDELSSWDLRPIYSDAG